MPVFRCFAFTCLPFGRSFYRSPLRGFGACALLAASLALSGCAQPRVHEPIIVKPLETQLIERVGEASAALLASTHGLDPEKPIIAATFVNIDDLQETSTLGRMLSEMFTSGLVQAGLKVIEVKMRNSLFIEEDAGELILSRDVQRLSLSHDAQAVLLGTYAEAERATYVNIRIVRARDNVILGATTVKLPMDRDVRALLPVAW